MKSKIMLTIFIVSTSVLVFSQENKPLLKLDIPLFDLPYQIEAMNTVGHGFFSSYANPSMSQSIALAVDLYSSIHFGMNKLQDRWGRNKWWKFATIYLGTFAADYLVSSGPPGIGWNHEEFHRAVMTRFGVNSFNMMNTFPIGQSAVSVNHVTDADIIRLKPRALITLSGCTKRE